MEKYISGLAVLLVIFLTAAAGVSFAASQGTIAEGRISVYRNGELSKKLSGMNPLEEGPLIICQGKCLIRSHGVSIVAEDKAELAIVERDGLFNLFVRKGHVEFVVSPAARKMSFNTPAGVYSIAEVVFNADSSPVVRGYMSVDESGAARVGVREGRMIFTTAKGPQTVKADQQIILALSDEVQKPVSGDEAARLKQEEEKKKKRRFGAYWWFGHTRHMALAAGLVTAAGVGALYAGYPGGYDHNHSSPKPGGSPTPSPYR